MILAACSTSSPTPAPSDLPATRVAPARVLMVTATAGFRHDSIATAQRVMASLGAATGEFTLTVTENLGTISAARLADHNVLVFALTSGELEFTAEQKRAIVDFVSAGGGFLGVHSATDTLYGWPEYGRLVGAYFREHPWTREGTVVVEDPLHPATTGLGDRFSITDEFYTFQDNPRPRVGVLLRLDAASVGSSGDYPLAWAHSFGSGRVYYNALGHFDSTWNDQRFQRQLIGAVRWAAKR